MCLKVCIDNNELGTFKTYGMITELLLKVTLSFQVDIGDLVNYLFILYIHGFFRGMPNFKRAAHCYRRANCFLGMEIFVYSLLN